jgi:WD40 repeat protein
MDDAQYARGRFDLRKWDPRTGKELRRFEDAKQIELDAITSISPDGKRLAVSHGKPATTTVFDTLAWQPLFRLPEPGGTMTRDGTQMVTAGRSIQFWDALTGTKLDTAIADRGHKPGFSPDGRWLGLCSIPKSSPHGPSGLQLQFWDVRSGQRDGRFAEAGDVHSFVFGPDSRLLVTRGYEVTFWDFVSGKAIQKLATYAGVIEVSPDGEWIAVAVSASIQLWRKSPSVP